MSNASPQLEVVSRLSPAIREVARHYPALELLVLHGSRARGDSREDSDWDFGFLAGSGLEPDALLAELVRATGSEEVDLVNLSRASGLLRYRAARDGLVLYESRSDAFHDFWLSSVGFWCDTAPILERGHADVLADLG